MSWVAMRPDSVVGRKVGEATKLICKTWKMTDQIAGQNNAQPK